MYSHHQSYQNLLSALPRSSPSTPKVEPSMERYSRFRSTSPPGLLSTLDARSNNSMKARFVPTPYGSPALTDEDLYSDCSSRSPSPLTRDTISIAHGSPPLRSMMDYFETMSDGSVSVDSLISDNSDSHHSLHHHINSGANISSTSSSTSTQNKTMTTTTSTGKLLLCPVCDKAFKPSKNQNCNLRRHLKNVHDMSPTIHPRKCKWDSLPDGRVKDDKDRKERTRKSKRLWARKFRLRRKVEEAAEVLTMLNQAN
ncbi:hypothetical protein CPB97_003124 [Podila verticillata]|nr:hypothetical protein CPB97_003124 [Podila verticillata]